MRSVCVVEPSPAGLWRERIGFDASRATGRRSQRAPDPDQGRAALHTNETSWFVGEPKSSLWILTNKAGTYYKIVSSRSKAAAMELMGD